LVDIAIDNKWLNENSILYALLNDTLISLKRQEEQFQRHGKLTKKKESHAPKGCDLAHLLLSGVVKLQTNAEKGL
jgi:hypothetical protein